MDHPVRSSRFNHSQIFSLSFVVREFFMGHLLRQN